MGSIPNQMELISMPEKVPFAIENLKRCICGQCPVQIKSKCVKEKLDAAAKLMSDPKKAKVMPKPKDIPRLYCSSGKASCKDIDANQMCICGSCAVWNEHVLADARPTMYFCLEGKAL